MPEHFFLVLGFTNNCGSIYTLNLFSLSCLAWYDTMMAIFLFNGPRGLPVPVNKFPVHKPAETGHVWNYQYRIS